MQVQQNKYDKKTTPGQPLIDDIAASVAAPINGHRTALIQQVEVHPFGHDAVAPLEPSSYMIPTPTAYISRGGSTQPWPAKTSGASYTDGLYCSAAWDQFFDANATAAMEELGYFIPGMFLNCSRIMDLIMMITLKEEYGSPQYASYVKKINVANDIP